MSEKKPAVTKEAEAKGEEKKHQHRHRHSAAHSAVPKQPKFEGECKDLSGNIFDCTGAKQAVTFINTRRALANYVGREYTNGGDMRTVIEDLEMPVIPQPDDPPAGASKSEQFIWQERCKEWLKQENILKQNIKLLYSLVWGQCTDTMKQKIEALSNYDDIKSSVDGLKLLKGIETIVYKFNSTQYLPHALHDNIRLFYLTSQSKTQTADEYLKEFNSRIAVIEGCGGSIGQHDEIAKMLAKEQGLTGILSAAVKKKLKEDARERYLATAYIMGADRSRYFTYLRSLENSFLDGNNLYPKTLQQAVNVLTNRKSEASVQVTTTNGVAFTQADDPPDDQNGTTLATDGSAGKKKSLQHIQCVKCKQFGHYANKCTTDTSTDQTTDSHTMLINGHQSDEFQGHNAFQFHQSVQGGSIPSSWILLDSQSTIDVFSNKDLLCNVRTVDTKMFIHCNAGVATTTQMGDLPNYGAVWYHPDGIANILSLSRVRANGYHVTYDSDNGNQFVVHKPNGTQRCFQQSPNGLFYSDTAETSTVLINTVDDNKSKFTNRDYSRAVLARTIQKTIGRPSTATFITIVEGNHLPNCPINRQDILNAEMIFGPDVGSLKGKTVRRSGTHVESTLVDIPPPIMDTYRVITLACDVMFVNRIPFFVTISRNIKFCTAETLPNQEATSLLQALKHVRSIYSKRGFRIDTVLMDNQFVPLREELSDLHITLNTVANGEHVPEVERHIRTLKERVRSVYNVLPFQRLPNRIVIELVYYCTYWLNSFPVADGISDTLSPRNIVTGQHIDYTKHCQLEFGTYVQTHEEHDNSMHTRTTGAIALRPTGNTQGGYYFFSLSTGRILNRNHWTPLPMPGEVIDRVHVLARRQARGLQFADLHGNAVIDDIDDADDPDDQDYNPDDDDAADDDDDDDDVNDASDDDTIVDAAADNASDDDTLADADVAAAPAAAAANLDPVVIAGVDDENGNGENNENNENNNNNNNNANENNDENNENNVENNDEIDNVNINDNLVENEHGAIAGVADPIAGVAEQMDDKYGARTGAYHLRERRPRDYSHLHTVLESTVMTQYNMHKGLKVFGDAGVTAVLKELNQLHTRKVLEPVEADSLSPSEKYASLQYLMFLKEKRDGTIKGRGCADGRKQREYTNKEEASSPTVAIESVFLTSVIDAHEGRDVATVDIPGAFMQADMDDVVHMKLEGTMAELLVKLDPKLYRKYVQTTNGKSVLYVQLKKALYGTLKAALLFWKKLTTKLKEWGFIINPYDWCVANKLINGKQCTIIWHVDDLKISHVDADVVSDIIKLIDAEFGKEAPITQNRGKVHDYLGMKLDYTIPGKVQISMSEYIQTMLDEAPADMDGVASTPAANHLFEVNETNPTKLDDTMADMFHHIVAKLLFLCKRARPDIQTAVAFLCTRVKSPDIDDYKKLIRVMRYLRGTVQLPLTMEAENLQIVKWWVDASFAVHPDMKSHTGGAMSLGKGTVYATSTRQRINTKSSTEAELVGVNDVLPQILWTRYFLEAQGYKQDPIIYQDNQSAMLLENNGRASSSKRTRHLNIRYFFVTDRVTSKEVRIEYCPTGDMRADFFTKPLQGGPFKKHRDFIMNVAPVLAPTLDHRSVLENDVTENGVAKSVASSEIKDRDDVQENEWTKVVNKRSNKRSKSNKLTLK
jgi:Reverse transcriptase (RNA-dependent DNA polymerase)